jgi:cyclomaltodextrinase
MEECSSFVSWFREAIVYHILVDRFAGYSKDINPEKPVFLGGKITGITDKLSYLADLGINTIWLSPVNKTTAYHGYHVTDFYATDKRFGSENDLKNLIHQAHSRNIRVILDFVPNHCSARHPFFIQASKSKKSLYRKWFYFSPFSDNYLSFLHFSELPKINLDFPDARNHIIGAAKHWMTLGVDGFRLDHAIGPSHSFWRAFRREIKAENPEAVLIGEAWLEGIGPGMLKTIRIRHKYLRWLLKFRSRDIQREYIDEFDGVLDFYFRHRITEYIAWKNNPDHFVNKFISAMRDHYRRFPENYFLPSFIDNHDMNRFLYEAGQQQEKLKLALKLQFSLPQPPILYYGTECGLSHHKPVQWDKPYSDIQARKPMPWESLDQEMIDYCKDLIWNRRKGGGS